MEAVADAAVPDVAADADPHSAEQLGIHDKTRRQIVAVAALEVVDDLLPGIPRQLGRSFDRCRALLHFEAEQAPVGFENMNVMARLLFNQRFEERRNPAGIELAVDKACPKELLRKLSRLFVDLHGAISTTRSDAKLLPANAADLPR